MSQKCPNKRKNNSNVSLTSRRTDGVKNLIFWIIKDSLLKQI